MRRRSARCFESQRLLASILPPTVSLDAVPGRLVVVADGATVAMMDRQGEDMVYNWALIGEMYGEQAVADLRSSIS